MLHHELASWRDEQFAGEWAEQDTLTRFLTLPRELASTVVKHVRPDIATVIDIASGPGGFLEVFLDRFPRARGIWTDGSPAMEARARENLRRFGDRVEYRIVDMVELSSAGLPAGADVVLSSRASHHLDPRQLTTFYRAAADLLAPGGWMANLDHAGRSDRWTELHRVVLRRMVGELPPRAGHTHQHPLPSLDAHLTAARAAGLDVDVVWATGRTVLLLGSVSDHTDKGSAE